MGINASEWCTMALIITMRGNRMQQVITYRRVSTSEQGDSRNGLEGQAQALQGFISAEGMQALADYEEVASGGSGLDRRPVLLAALAHARQAKALLLVSKLDRLSRSVAFISDMMARAVPFATAEDGLEVKPLMLHMRATIAEHERATIGERTRAGLAIVKARGTVLGFAAHADPVESRRKAVQAMTQTNRDEANRFAASLAPDIRSLQGAGMTMAQVAQALNRMGVRTLKGGTWHASTVCNLLKRA